MSVAATFVIFFSFLHFFLLLFLHGPTKRNSQFRVVVPLCIVCSEFKVFSSQKQLWSLPCWKRKYKIATCARASPRLFGFSWQPIQSLMSIQKVLGRICGAVSWRPCLPGLVALLASPWSDSFCYLYSCCFPSMCFFVAQLIYMCVSLRWTAKLGKPAWRPPSLATNPNIREILK